MAVDWALVGVLTAGDVGVDSKAAIRLARLFGWSDTVSALGGVEGTTPVLDKVP